MSRWCWVAALFLLGACEGENGAMDGSVSADAAVADAATSTDAEVSMDSGSADDAGEDAAVDAGYDAASPLDAGPASARQVPRPLGTTAAANGYFEYLPPRYGDGADHPLLVFWHGIGENGDGTTELDLVLRGGPPRLIDRDRWPADRPFIVLSPQHGGGGCPSAIEIHDFLTYAIASYDVDVSRVYLTGLSCGAIGSWSYFGQFVDAQVAALVLIAGDGRGAFGRSGCELGRVPIWAFHGDADTTVSPQGTIEPMTALMACDPAPREAVMTIYPGVGHDSWSRTYDGSAGHDIYAWMLGFTRP